MNYIPLNLCKHRHLYHIESRNAQLGIFDEKTNSFIIARDKYGYYLFEEEHWDVDGTAMPLQELTLIPDTLELNLNSDELLDYLIYEEDNINHWPDLP